MEKREGQDAAVLRLDDPWYDEPASGWGEPDRTDAGAAAAPELSTDRTPGGRSPTGRRSAHTWFMDGRPTDRTVDGPGAADIYLEVQRSPAFQEVRSRYRRFVVPAGLAFLLWYLAYVVAATTAPALMARPVAGAVNVAMVAGLAQFLTTFLLTWAYARHARLRRDRAALDLRWTVFDRARIHEPTATVTATAMGTSARAEAVRGTARRRAGTGGFAGPGPGPGPGPGVATGPVTAPGATAAEGER